MYSEVIKVTYTASPFRPTAAGHFPPVRTTPCGCGTRSAANKCASLKATAIRFGSSRLRATDGWHSPAAKIALCESGAARAEFSSNRHLFACTIEVMDLANSPGIRREFLGWDRPALPEAAHRLAQRYRQGHTLDLSRLIVVAPGQRAGRRLRELLAFLAEDKGLVFTPPNVVTEGLLPELLYTPKKPFATDLVQDLAWAQVLRELPGTMRRHLVPQPPDDGDTRRWLELGQVLRRLHRELAADGLDFAAVLAAAPKVAHFNERERWQALTELQRRYHLLLDTQELWDRQTARLKAIEFREIRTESDIV